MDRDLARRLERTEGAVSSSYVTARQQLAPERAAQWHDFDGTYAIFDGVDSPLTQTFGIGLFAPSTPTALSAIEAFFAERGAPVLHEVSPLAGVATTALLVERRYRPVEMSTVLVQHLDRDVAAPTGGALRVYLVGDGDDPAAQRAWIDASVGGWSEQPEIAPVIQSISELVVANRQMLRFAVEQDGAIVAAGAMGIHGSVALLAGASTLPAARGRGAQTLLLAARLAEARRRGCDLAMMVTEPGSTSQRNAERNGFRVAYTRTKWCTDAASR